MNKRKWKSLTPEIKQSFVNNSFSGNLEDDMAYMQLEGYQVELVTRSAENDAKEQTTLFYCIIQKKKEVADNLAYTLNDAFYGACYHLDFIM